MAQNNNDRCERITFVPMRSSINVFEQRRQTTYFNVAQDVELTCNYIQDVFNEWCPHAAEYQCIKKRLICPRLKSVLVEQKA